MIEHLNQGTARPSDLFPDVWKLSHPEAIRVYRQDERRDKAETARLRASKGRLPISPRSGKADSAGGLCTLT